MIASVRRVGKPPETGRAGSRWSMSTRP